MNSKKLYTIQNHLDKFELIDNILNFTGWVFFRDNSDFNKFIPADSILVTDIDNKLIYKSEKFFLREDVLEVYGISSKLETGFNLQVFVDTKIFNIKDNYILGKNIKIFICINDEIHEISYFDKTHLHFELVGECNLKCVMCPQVFGIYNQNMTKDELNNLSNFINRFRYISPYFQGELLLKPDLFEHFLSLLSSQQKIFITTNAVLLNNKNIELILKNYTKIEDITISIDSVDDIKFKNIRGAEFSKVKRNIFNLKESLQSKNLSNPKIKINSTIMNYNLYDVIDLMYFAKELEVSEINFTFLWPGYLHGGEKWVVNKKDFTFNYDLESDIKLEDMNKVKSAIIKENKILNLNCKINGKTVEENIFEIIYEIKDCPHIYQNAVVLGNGVTKFCCQNTSSLFDWRKFDIQNFDNHPSVINARTLARNNSIPDCCDMADCEYINCKSIANTKKIQGRGLYIERRTIE
ncbi:radical SAM protein [Aliarcobacter butzleri]|uniref:radical SAM protein n=1 Tax=Aliarcobacter butzleri TaxID=28197 RepID=UPI001260991F|nr:radical SAM protein [Aliarcobacter butzleri]